MPAAEKAKSNTYLAPAHLDHIRATVDWQALFNGLNLHKDEKRSKPDDWWAWSPFKDEKTPSFHMKPRGIWYDFAVGMGGGPIELIQRLRNCNCYEAGHFILDNGWARDALSVQNQRHETKKKVEKASGDAPRNEPIRQDLLPMCTYHEYIASRGISPETCAALGIGYLPQGRSSMKGRVVFQIRDARLNTETGEREPVILSHMGRVIDDETQPKYLFYEGFHKSAELYGQEVIWTDLEAKRQIQETGHIVLTEGPFDIAKAYEAGLRNVVACLGSSLSGTQAERMKDLSENFEVGRVLVCFDRDEAGHKQTQAAIARLKGIGLYASGFDWAMQLSAHKNRAIPSKINDLGDMTTRQLAWLREKSLI